MVDTTGDPTAPRFQLASEIKAARERTGMSPRQVAAHLKNTDATVRRWERGEGAPRHTDLEAMFRLYKISDPDQQAMLEEMRVQAGQKVWYSRFNPNDQMARMLGFEGAATEIWIWERSLITGLLQTEAYARAVIETIDYDAAPERIEHWIKLRIARQKRVLESAQPPNLRVLVDEDAICRQVGTAQEMYEQLAYVLKGPHRNYELRVMPSAVGVHPGSLGSFYVFDFPESLRKPAVYSDGPFRNLFLDEEKEIGRARVRFERMWGLALSRGKTRDLINAVMKELYKG